jgi:nicotinamidase-related amidase
MHKMSTTAQPPVYSSSTTNWPRYAEGHLKTSNVANTRAAISTLLEKYRAASAPIIHIVHATPPGAPVFTPETPLADEFSELTPKNGEKVISKQFPGSFTGTELEEAIKATGRNQLVLTGYMAHVCVSTTARQASERGYDVVIAEEAVGDRDIPGATAEELVKTVLAELADAFGTVLKVGSIV